MADPRIPPIITPLSDEGGRPSSIWYRYWIAVQESIRASAQVVNLGFLRAPDKGTVTNSAGTDAEIPVFTTTSAGLVPSPGAPGGPLSPRRVLHEDGWDEAGDLQFFYQTDAPTFPPAKPGDTWMSDFDGIYYVAIDDGTSKQWVEP